MLLSDHLDVLVVESQPTMRAQLRTMLSSIGIESAQYVVSASAAMKRLREKRFDLVLCEYNLGDGQDGQQLLEELRAHAIMPPDSLFVMISSEHDFERITSACELQISDYILKPLNAESLRVRLLRAFDKRDAFVPAWQLASIGDPLGAIEYCRIAADEHPQYLADFMRMQAELRASMGQIDEAESIYREVNSAHRTPWAELGIARMLALKKQYAEAEELLTGVVERNAKFIEAYDLLGQVRERIGANADACSALRSATLLSPHRLQRLRTLGELYLKDGVASEASRVFGDVVRKGRHSTFRNPEDHVRLVQAQLAANQTAEAQETIADLDRSLGRSPKGELCKNLCTALVHAHNDDKAAAQAALAAAVRSSSEVRELSASLRQDVANACFDQDMQTEGCEVVMDLLRTAEDEQALERANAILGKRGLTQLAQQLEARMQAEVKSLVSTGAEKAYAGDYDGAVTEMMNAVRKMPGNPHVLFNASLALLRHIEHRGWNDVFAAQARNLIQRAHKLSPQNPRLAAITEFMHRLVKQYGIRPDRALPRLPPL